MTFAGGDIIARLRDGSWFDRRHVRAGAIILLLVQLAAFLFIVAGTHGWIVPLTRPTTTDFVSFYAAGKLADAGTPALAYDHAAHLKVEEQATSPGIEYEFFNYPPVYQLVFTVLAPLPYLVAFLLFEGATLALWLFVGRRILDERGTTAAVALAAFPIVFWNFGLGQNAFLTAALFGAATLQLERRPIVAGMLFGALCYKPQFGLLLPFALAAGGYWRTIAAAAATVVALVLLSVLVLGADTWHAFLATAGASPAMYQSGRVLFAGMANPFGAMRLLGADPPVAYVVQIAASLSALVLVVAVWRARLSLPTRAAVLAAATLVAAPLSLLYDLMLAAVAGCWLIRDRASPAAAGWERTVLVALYVILLDGRGIAEALHVPAFPLAALALLAIAVARAWREAALSRAPVVSPITAETGSRRVDKDAGPAPEATPS
jgi:alpha-1,2-mannosyltransferase